MMTPSALTRDRVRGLDVLYLNSIKYSSTVMHSLRMIVFVLKKVSCQISQKLVED